jgi:hypothetical protein
MFEKGERERADLKRKLEKKESKSIGVHKEMEESRVDLAKVFLFFCQISEQIRRFLPLLRYVMVDFFVNHICRLGERLTVTVD